MYVEEIERGPHPIEGVPTAIAAMLGATERGPLRPGLISSYAQYLREFGGIFGNVRHMPPAVRGFFENGGRKLFVCRIASATATTAQADLPDYLLRACGPGAWGNRIWVKLEDGSTLDGNDAPVGFRLRVAYFPESVAPYDCFDPANIANPGKPQVVEEYDDLEAGRLEDSLQSAVIVLTRNDVAARERRPAHFNGTLEGGADGAALEAADFAAQGLAALDGDSCRDVALVCAPAADPATQRALVAHCEASRFRFAILDAARGATLHDGLTPRADIADTSYAAFYSPWIKVADPAGGAPMFVPPCGHVMGVYARTDMERGVFKAPAGEILRGALAPEQAFDEPAQELLTPRGVDVIRDFPGRGILVWGARTLSSKPDWKYVGVRRLFIYLERSIYVGTQWVVFEPNGESLWARVRGVVQQFLHAQWRAGMLLGTRPEEAFFVKCDRTTMSQSDLDLGHLICLVGIAAVKPAEFLIITIQQLTADSSPS